jgi:Flp pilus assembly protein TadD
LYLKGLFHRHRRTPADLQIALDCFQRAIEIEPDFAQAYAALAFTHATRAHFHYEMAAPNDVFPLARAAAEKALALSERIAEAHMVQGVLKAYFEWDWPAAERAFVRALKLDPDNPYTLANYAIVGVLPGQSGKFVTLSRRSEMLDPFWINAKTQVGIGLFLARRYSEAEERLEQTCEMQPDWPISPLYLGDIQAIHNQFDRAESWYRRVVEITGRGPAILSRLGVLEAIRGRHAAARELLEELASMRRSQYVRSSYRADIYFHLNEKDEAYALMRQAVEERDTRLVILHVSPFYDAFKSEPRFQALLGTVGLRADE